MRKMNDLRCDEETEDSILRKSGSNEAQNIKEKNISEFDKNPKNTIHWFTS